MIQKIKHLPIILLLLLCAGYAKASGTAGPDQTICINNGGYGATVANMAGTGTGSWLAFPSNPGTTNFIHPTDPFAAIIDFPVAGVYGFSWGASTRDTVYVTVTAAAPAPILGVRGTCLSRDTLAASALAGADSIWWWHEGSVISMGFATNSFYMPTDTGTYFICTCTGGCISLFSDTVTISNCVSAGPNQTICFNTAANMSATGTGTWAAHPGNPAPLAFVNPADPHTSVSGFTIAGTYALTWTTGTTLDTIFIVVRPQLTVSAGHDTTLCSGGCASMGGSPTVTGGSSPYTYFWIDNLSIVSTLSNPMFCPSTSTRYTVFANDANGCLDSSSMLVNLTNCPLSAGPDQMICFHYGFTSMAATGSGTWSEMPGNPTHLNFWNPNSSVTYVQFTTVVGVYGAIWTSAGGADTMYMTVNPQIQVHSAHDTTICSGTCLNIGGSPTATGGTGVLTYQWYQGSLSVISTLSNPVVCPIGSYVYTVLVTDANGCSDTSWTNVTVNTCGVGTAGPDQSICQNNSFGYATAFMAATGAGSWSSLATNPSATTISVPSSPTTFIQGFTVPGIYGFVWSSDTVYVTVLPSPARPRLMLVGPCIGSDSLILTGGHGDSILWVIGTTTLHGVNGADSILRPVSATSYLAFIFGANGCYSDLSDTVYVRPCTLDSVWPGDADSNHLVDNNDLLPIGIGYGATGPVRAVTGSVWQADAATDWSSSFASGENYKHADCDGSGTIDAADTIPIMTNFGMIHAKTNRSPAPWRSGIAGLSLQVSNDTVVQGDTLLIKLMLGDAATPVANIYGLAFTLNYDPIVFDSNTTSFRFENSWLGNSGNSIHISKDFSGPGTVKAAITGIDHLNRSGHGEIGQYVGTITTGNINGKNLKYYVNRFYITDVKAVDIHGTIITINEGFDSNRVAYEPAGINENSAATHLSILPNPASNQVKVIAESNITEIAITDILGKVVMTDKAVGRAAETLDVSQFEPGVYIIHVSTGKGNANAKLIVNR